MHFAVHPDVNAGLATVGAAVYLGANVLGITAKVQPAFVSVVLLLLLLWVKKRAQRRRPVTARRKRRSPYDHSLVLVRVLVTKCMCVYVCLNKALKPFFIVCNKALCPEQRSALKASSASSSSPLHAAQHLLLQADEQRPLQLHHCQTTTRPLSAPRLLESLWHLPLEQRPQKEALLWRHFPRVLARRPQRRLQSGAVSDRYARPTSVCGFCAGAENRPCQPRQ